MDQLRMPGVKPAVQHRTCQESSIQDILTGSAGQQRDSTPLTASLQDRASQSTSQQDSTAQQPSPDSPTTQRTTVTVVPRHQENTAGLQGSPPGLPPSGSRADQPLGYRADHPSGSQGADQGPPVSRSGDQGTPVSRSGDQGPPVSRGADQTPVSLPGSPLHSHTNPGSPQINPLILSRPNVRRRNKCGRLQLARPRSAGFFQSKSRFSLISLPPDRAHSPDLELRSGCKEFVDGDPGYLYRYGGSQPGSPATPGSPASPTCTEGPVERAGRPPGRVGAGDGRPARAAGSADSVNDTHTRTPRPQQHSSSANIQKNKAIEADGSPGKINTTSGQGGGRLSRWLRWAADATSKSKDKHGADPRKSRPVSWQQDAQHPVPLTTDPGDRLCWQSLEPGLRGLPPRARASYHSGITGNLSTITQ